MAAFIPLIAGVTPAIINLISGLVHKYAPVAEASNGPETGAVKFADVFKNVVADLTNAAQAGQISSALPPDELIKTVIQSVVNSMQRLGKLGAPVDGPAYAPAPPAPLSNSLFLNSGQSITIFLNK